MKDVLVITCYDSCSLCVMPPYVVIIFNVFNYVI